MGFGCIRAPEFGIDLFSNFLRKLDVGLENIPIFKIEVKIAGNKSQENGTKYDF